MDTCDRNGKPRLRVLFFEGGEFGGSVGCLGEMIQGLAALGCEVGVVSFYEQTGPIDLRSLDGVHFWRCLDLPPRVRPRPEVGARTWGIPHLTRFGMRYLMVALRALRCFRPDIVYFNDEIASGIPGAIAAKLLGIPMICHLRIARDLHPLERLLAGFFNRFIVLTKAGQQVAQANGIPEHKLTQLYDPFDVSAFTQRNREALSVDIPWEDDGVYVIQVGTLNDRKRPMLALDAFTYARSQCPNLRLVFAGSGPLQDTLAPEARNRGLEGSVHLIGDCLQIPALLRHGDIGLFTSASEGLGLVILEFMAAGLPVVTWNMPLFRELIADGETGIIVKKDDTEHFAEVLVRLYQSAELRRRLGRTGRASIEKDTRFDPQAHAHRILDVLRTTARRNNSHSCRGSADNVQS